MLKKLKSFYNQKNLCMENNFVSLCLALNRNVSNLYAYSWNFGYIPNAMTDGTVLFGKRILPSRDGQGMNSEQINAMEMCCGIYPMLHVNFGLDNFVDLVKRELEAERPVVIGTDIFYCNWHKSYNKYHSIHYSMIVGINEEGFICIDDTLASYDGNLILEDRPETIILGFDTLKRFNFGYITFKIKEDKCEYSNDEMIYISALKTITGYNGTSDFISMRNLVKDMEDYLDIEKEIKGFEDAWAVDLVRCFNYIIWSRTNYGMFLDDKKQYKNTDISLITNKLKKATDLWEGTKNYILKYAITPDSNFDKYKVCEGVMKACEMEEKIAYEIVGKGL